MSRKVIIAPESTQKSVTIDFDDPEESKDVMTPEHKAALRRCELRKQFTSIQDQFAESNLYQRNYKYRNADKMYPGELDFDERIVTRCYPYAKGGMLLMDEPKNEKQKEKAYIKQKKLWEAGVRHVVFEEKMDVFDLAKQLEGFKCPGPQPSKT